MPSEVPLSSPTYATISLPALAHNLAELRRLLAPSCTILAVVKADAYGHGAVTIAQACVQLGITRLGVATVQEGIALREQGLRVPILVMGGLFPWQVPDLLHYALTPVLSDETLVSHCAELIASKGTGPYPVHLKIDTGMRRLGLTERAFLSLLHSPLFSSSDSPLQLEGVMTHLADADNPDPEFTREQLARFQRIVHQVRQARIPVTFFHAANTAGIVSHPTSHYELVRPGLFLYGYTPRPNQAPRLSLKPLLRLSTRIVQIRTVKAGERVSYHGQYRPHRTSRLAILPVGYAHGYARSLSNKGMVLVGQHRAPIVGTICMDMMLIDVTDLPSVHPGDNVTLLGTNGTEAVTAHDLARWQSTIPYEILCHLGSHVPRIYEPLQHSTSDSHMS